MPHSWHYPGGVYNVSVSHLMYRPSSVHSVEGSRHGSNLPRALWVSSSSGEITLAPCTDQGDSSLCGSGTQRQHSLTPCPSPANQLIESIPLGLTPPPQGHPGKIQLQENGFLPQSPRVTLICSVAGSISDSA